MDDRSYRVLKWTALIIAVLVFGVMLYQTFVIGRPPGDQTYLEGEQFFADGEFVRALDSYERTIAIAPDHFHAKRSRARTLMQLEQYDEALAAYDHVIGLDPDFAPAYANRGILKDRMGRYQGAIEDYEKALAMDAELAKGPHWMTRFLRNQAHRPPGIPERAQYLRSELAKPENERVLRVPELDAKQRAYKQ